MSVSVVIPAYNAEETIADTLRSLIDQTYSRWEAIVVDDGSTDATPAIVDAFVNRDARVRLLRQENQGESGARNSGISLARFDWLLFLDSDDWILPEHLERLTQHLESEPALDAAYCGWAYATPDGSRVFGSCPTQSGDLFVEHAGYCVSIVHTYVVRKSLVDEARGFDRTLRTCADWDLWQRIARTGARFGAVPETLAMYRMRAGSATRDGRQLLVDGLRVIETGHAPDPRVHRPHPLHANGAPAQELAERQVELACACAGYVIGGGGDARALLELLPEARCPRLDVYAVASCVFRHTLVAASRPLSEFARIWPGCIARVVDFLAALEACSGTPDLARRARPCLHHLIRIHAPQRGLMGAIGSRWSRLMIALHQRRRYRFRMPGFARTLLAGLLRSTRRRRVA